EIGQRAGPALRLRKVGRGAAAGDFDNDGRVDLLVTNLGDAPSLLRNLRTPTGNSIKIALVGTRSNRDGLGAQIEVTTKAGTQHAEARANSSYESASDPRVHFGLGSATRVEVITVRWPSGVTDTVRGEKASQLLVIKESSGVERRELGRG